MVSKDCCEVTLTDRPFVNSYDHLLLQDSECRSPVLDAVKSTRETPVAMKESGDVGLVRWRKDVHGNPPHYTPIGQGSSVGVWVVVEKITELLPIGKVVDMCWWIVRWVNDRTGVAVELSYFQFVGIKHLKRPS